MADDAERAPSLPFHEKSDSEKDHLFKNIAAQLDRIATEFKDSAQIQTGQLSLM